MKTNYAISLHQILRLLRAKKSREALWKPTRYTLHKNQQEKKKRNENIQIHYCANLIIGDIIHLIGYYPMNRPTTTSTYRPPSFDPPTNNKPYYHYPQNDHQNNEWNYESNHIPHGPTYTTFNTQPIATSSSSGYYGSNSKPSSSHNTYNYNNYGSNGGGNGFLDADTGYQLTPSPVVSQNDYHHRPKPQRPSSNRPSNGFNEDYDDGYNYGSYQGIVTISEIHQKPCTLHPYQLLHVINALYENSSTSLVASKKTKSVKSKANCLHFTPNTTDFLPIFLFSHCVMFCVFFANNRC